MHIPKPTTKAKPKTVMRIMSQIGRPSSLVTVGGSLVLVPIDSAAAVVVNAVVVSVLPYYI